MCGICGLTWSDSDLIRKMGEKIKHRGPEQEGFYIDNHVSLCCERLKILDLRETAKQPQHNEDSSIWVVLNGEIYNFRALKKKTRTPMINVFFSTVVKKNLNSYDQRCFF